MQHDETPLLPWQKSWIYDADSLLTASKGTDNDMPQLAAARLEPVAIETYIRETFVPDQLACGRVPERFRSWFRVVPACGFLDWFASDRSHMLCAPAAGYGERWHAPPPPWPPIAGPASVQAQVMHNHISAYVHMSSSSGDGQDSEQPGGAQYGRVYRDTQWFALHWTAIPHPGSTLQATPDGSTPSTSLLPLSLSMPSMTQVDQSAERISTSASEGAISLIPNAVDAISRPKPGGRISSPLFPAYLHASQQHRLAATGGADTHVSR
jgi:hypothetical protein